MKCRYLVIILAVAALPAAGRAGTIAIVPPVVTVEFPAEVLRSVESAIEAELSAEPELTVISMSRVQEIWAETTPCPEGAQPDDCFDEILESLSSADMLLMTRITRGPGGAWLSVKIHQIPGGKLLGESRLKSVTPEDAAARAREAVAEARGRRAEMAPETGAETRVGATVVDGVALKPAGQVLKPQHDALKPAGQVLKPQRETIEVAPDAGGVPVKPAGEVIEPGQGDGAMAGNVLAPEPSDSKPAGQVIEAPTERIPVPGEEAAHRWNNARPPAARPPGAPQPTRSDSEWYAGWASLGVGLALGGTAIYFAGQLRDSEGNRDDNMLATQVTGGLAVAAAVTGVTLLLLSRQEEAAPAASAALAPVRGGAVAGIAARF